MARYRTYIEHSGNTYEIVNKIGFGGSTLNTSREDDQIFYRTVLSGEVSIRKETNEAIYNILESIFNDRTRWCEEVEFYIDKICEGTTYSRYWEGKFTAPQMKINKCVCRIDFDLRPNDVYECVFSEWERKVNFYNFGNKRSYRAVENTLVNATATVTHPLADYLAQNAICPPFPTTPFGSPTLKQLAIDTSNAGPALNPPINQMTGGDFNVLKIDGGALGCPYGIGSNPNFFKPEYEYYRPTETTITTSGGNIVVSTDYQTESTTSVTPPLGTGWFNVPTTNTWIRKPFDGGFFEDSDAAYLFNNAIEDVATDISCIDSVVSDFFNINPDATAPVNDAYQYAQDYLQNMLIVHNSDAIRPDADIPAKSFLFEISLKDLLEDLVKMFNVRWVVDGGVLRIEHVSYFTKDTATIECSKICNLSLQTETPERENWNYDLDQSFYFTDKDIVYINNCGNTSKKDYKTAVFSNDIGYIQENLEEPKRYSFTLLSTKIVSGDHVVMNYNRPLAYSELLPALWTWDRYQYEGEVIGSLTTFDSNKYVKQTNAIPCGCDCEIDPNKIYETECGDGEVIEIEEKIQSGLIKVTFGYDQ